MPVDEPWEQLRSRLRIGECLTGTIVRVPKPGAIGIFVDLGLSVGGFVDFVLMSRRDPARWPAEGTVTDFEIWWMDERPQIRLKPVDPAYLVEDFDCWVAQQNSGAAKQWLQRAGGRRRDV
ncbi:hypothetical protein ACFVYE_32755 [Streptomyces sp. NPDC058239]|uniref:hypothetical protein n=1 Tax=Streptomyces sp. NPDC058239 TaxID=3346395 RepID=UPI0036E2D19C